MFNNWNLVCTSQNNFWHYFFSPTCNTRHSHTKACHTPNTPQSANFITSCNGKHTSQKEKTRQTAGPTDQQLFQLLTSEQAPVPPYVPKDQDEMYFFTLSLVPRLNRLSRSSQTHAQVYILQYLADLEKKEELPPAHADRPTPCPSQQSTQPSGFNPYPTQSHFQQCTPPLPSTDQLYAQPPLSSPQGRQYGSFRAPPQTGGVKRSVSMLIYVLWSIFSGGILKYLRWRSRSRDNSATRW